MNVLESIILGLTQGLTEFIPVSSSGHLEIVQEIMGGRSGDFHLFLEFINFGTLLALLIFYRKRIWTILEDIFKRKNFKLAINVIITTIPAALLGFLLSDFIESSAFFSNMCVIMSALALVGFVMIFIDKIPHLSKIESEEKLTPKRALLIGAVQCCALVPGVSRSGSTIVAGRLAGLNSKSAADYSFIASIPIMCGVILKSVISSSSRAYIAANLPMLILSNIVAFVSGYLAINFVIKFLRKNDSLKAFGIYRVVVAAIFLVFVLIA